MAFVGFKNCIHLFIVICHRDMKTGYLILYNLVPRDAEETLA